MRFLAPAFIALAACSPDGAAPASSNILREDYVGPEACGKCHPQNHAGWKAHPHSGMNRMAGLATVVGDFSGVTLRYGGAEAVFRRDGDAFFVDTLQDGKRVRSARVTRTIGWRYLQEYVGVQVEGPEPKGDPIYREESRIRFGYVIKDRRWLPQSFLDSPCVEPERQPDGALSYNPFIPERTPFNARCVHCHNTYPYEMRLYAGDRLQGFAPAPVPLVSALLAGRPGPKLHDPVLPTSSLVTVGISCESCHLGGREHAANPKTPPRFVPTHPSLAGWQRPDSDRKNPAVVNALCRQCHFSGTGTWADGSALVNSMESIEQGRSGCRSAIKCSDCHNPHQKGPDAAVGARPESIAACLNCHPKYKSPDAARAHGRHESATCLDCHMPRTVQGFDEINRTHRISSPSEPAILASGMPNACNLCHLDRSLAWTRDELKKGWGRDVPLPGTLESVFGKGLGAPSGEAWLAQKDAGMVRTVVGAASARLLAAKRPLSALIAQLDDPNAYMRTRSLQNLEHALGRKLEEREFSLTGPPEERRRQIDTLLKAQSPR